MSVALAVPVCGGVAQIMVRAHTDITNIEKVLQKFGTFVICERYENAHSSSSSSSGTGNSVQNRANELMRSFSVHSNDTTPTTTSKRIRYAARVVHMHVCRIEYG